LRYDVKRAVTLVSMNFISTPLVTLFLGVVAVAVELLSPAYPSATWAALDKIWGRGKTRS
jgi:hypothetical protein